MDGGIEVKVYTLKPEKEKDGRGADTGTGQQG